MLTIEQEKWVNHLSDENKIKIIPFDISAEEKFQKIKRKIIDCFGKDIDVRHCGATSFGISGQDEIDVYLPVLPEEFDSFVAQMEKIFGKPRSLYPLERVRFMTNVDEKHVDIFVINKEHESWKNSVKFEKYLRNNAEALEKYRKLKEDGGGLSVREYYRRKIEFINQILMKS